MKTYNEILKDIEKSRAALKATEEKHKEITNKIFNAIDFRAIKTGSYLFHSADINKISATQYKQTIDFFINQGFKNTEV